jgi:hypothetical protein
MKFPALTETCKADWEQDIIARATNRSLSLEMERRRNEAYASRR